MPPHRPFSQQPGIQSPAPSTPASRCPARWARSPPAGSGGAAGLLGGRLLLRGLLGGRGGLGPLLVLGLDLVPLLVLVFLLFLLLLLLSLWLVHWRLRQGGQLLMHGLQLEDTGRRVRTLGWVEGDAPGRRLNRLPRGEHPQPSSWASHRGVTRQDCGANTAQGRQPTPNEACRRRAACTHSTRPSPQQPLRAPRSSGSHAPQVRKW